MSYLDQNIALEDAISSFLVEPIEIEFSNSVLDIGPLNEWIRFSVIDADSNQASMGGTSTNLYRHNGLVLINVFTLPNSGARRCLEILDILSQFFHEISIEGMTFFAPDISHIGVVDGWYQKNISCTFFRDGNF